MKKTIKRIDEQNYDFSFENFTGPLDLLLHLAKTNEIEISSLSLDSLIDQYIHFIEQVHEQGIDIASSYLEMAAELIRLKSQMLLPDSSDDEELLEELEALGLDRDTLINRLLEYKQYKEIVANFNGLIEKRNSYLVRAPEKLSSYRQLSFKNSLSIDEFVAAAKKSIMHELENKKETKIIETHEIGMEQYIDEMKILTEEFCFEKRVKVMTKNSIIALFLGVLESLKLHYISMEYREGLIYIMPIVKGDEDNEE